MNSIVFGAGNIGRGFLAKLLHDAGHTVTFVDVNEQVVDLINERREYPVYVVSNQGVTESTVRNVRAISFADTPSLIQAIVEAELILTAVGKNALGAVATVLADGLAARVKQRPSEPANLIVVACENMVGNTEYLAGLIRTRLDDPHTIRSVLAQVSTPNCVVDRIVPNVKPDGNSPLAVAVEEYFQLVIDATGLKQEFPPVPGIELATNLPALLEQKLFTLNMAHAIVAYYGYLSGYRFIHEAMADKVIRQLLAGALAEVEAIIVSVHGIAANEQRTYAAKVVARFENQHLRDEVVRVARDPWRKLGTHDRLIRPAITLMAQGQLPAHLATGIAAALHYDYSGDVKAQQLATEIQQRGISQVLQSVSGIPAEADLSRLVTANYLLRAL